LVVTIIIIRKTEWGRTEYLLINNDKKVTVWDRAFLILITKPNFNWGVKMKKNIVRLFLPLILLSVFSMPVQAGMISTDQMLQQSGRERLITELQKQEVQQQLVDMGVDPKEALNRVENLTDTEIAELNQKIDALPAGGRGSNLVIVLLIIIVRLLL